MLSKSPHIILIMTDQQRFDTIAEWGYDHAITPHQDRLVREGLSCRQGLLPRRDLYCLTGGDIYGHVSPA